MAGPCLDVYLPRELSQSDESQIRELIGSISNAVDGDSFWVANQPFMVRFGELEHEDRALILDGWTPKAVASFCAMCNSICDHVLLATICHRTAQLLNGMIVLGDISTITHDPSVLTFEGTRPIQDYGYIVRPEFLGYWLGHPDFRLVK